MKFLGLALRNQLRNRRRTALTLSALAVGMAAVLLFGGFVASVIHGLETSTVRRMGHIQIQKKGYFLFGSGNPAAYGIADYEKLIAALRTDTGIGPLLQVATPILTVTGVAGNFGEGLSRTFVGMGMVPSDQARMRQWNQHGLDFPARALPLQDGAPRSGVVGVGLARVLQLCGPLNVPDCPRPEREKTAAALPARLAQVVEAEDGRPRAGRDGVHIELLAATAQGAPNVGELNIVQAESQGVRELDEIFVGLHLDLAQRLIYGQGRREATAVVLQLQHSEDIPAALARLRELIAQHSWALEARSFTELNPTYGSVAGMFRAIFGFLAALMGVIVLFSVANAINMAVSERVVEIGTLRAMGMRRSGIRRLFVSEGLMLGALGTAAGAALALAVAGLINRAGLRWLPPNQVDPVPLALDVAGDPLLLAGGAAVLMLLAAGSSLLPASRAARLPVVEALRHV